MRAAIIDEPGRIRVGEVPDPTPARDAVVIRVGACGVCGTDLHIADGEFPPTPYPIVPGHEFAGEVVAVGADAAATGPAGLAEGMRVAVDPSLFCGHCRFCRVQKGNLCENWGATGDTVDGAFAEYVAVPAATVYPLPDDVSFREGAMVEPLACAVHGMRRLAPAAGDSVLVVGAGTMGLLLVQLARHGGASDIAVCDLNERRLGLASGLGATMTAASVTELRDAVPLGFHCVIDATGVPKAIEDALGAVRRGGKFMVFGVAPSDATVTVSPFRIYNDEITVVGSMAVLATFSPALALLHAGAVDLGALLSLDFPLEQFPDALQAVRDGRGLKVQVLPNGDQ